MRWPFARRETRADSSYTDALIQAITANAAGETTAFPTATAALEACAGFVGRAFAAAEVATAARNLEVLTPACLSMIGRALIRRGEIVLLIRVENGRLRLLPAASHDVDGGPDPSTWHYGVTLGGPARTLSFDNVDGASVVHIAYARDPEQPWRGLGPLQVAQLAGRLSAETVAALADEASGPRGAFLPVPVDGNDPTIATIKTDIRKARGNILLGQGGDWDTGKSGGRAMWKAERFGPAPTDALVELMGMASAEVYSACGLNQALFVGGEGTAKRESYRQALHSVIAPLGRLVSYELALKLDSDVGLDWIELRAGDIAGRARAFQSLVSGGVDVAKAAALAGLMMSDE